MQNLSTMQPQVRLQTAVMFCHPDRMTTQLQRFLREEREKRSLNKEDAEAAAGIGRGQLTRLEDEGRTPSRSTLERLSKFYGARVEQLKLMAVTTDATERVVEKPHRYPLVEERLVWARATGQPPELIAMFEARVGAFKGEPTEEDVDDAWTKARSRLKSFAAEVEPSEVFKVRPKVPRRRA
jgi:transcriptional regulator with XRE-family HTH domain